MRYIGGDDHTLSGEIFVAFKLLQQGMETLVQYLPFWFQQIFKCKQQNICLLQRFSQSPVTHLILTSVYLAGESGDLLHLSFEFFGNNMRNCTAVVVTKSALCPLFEHHFVLFENNGALSGFKEVGEIMADLCDSLLQPLLELEILFCPEKLFAGCKLFLNLIEISQRGRDIPQVCKMEQRFLIERFFEKFGKVAEQCEGSARIGVKAFEIGLFAAFEKGVFVCKHLLIVAVEYNTHRIDRPHLREKESVELFGECLLDLTEEGVDVVTCIGGIAEKRKMFFQISRIVRNLSEQKGANLFWNGFCIGKFENIDPFERSFIVIDGYGTPGEPQAVAVFAYLLSDEICFLFLEHFIIDLLYTALQLLSDPLSGDFVILFAFTAILHLFAEGDFGKIAAIFDSGRVAIIEPYVDIRSQKVASGGVDHSLALLLVDRTIIQIIRKKLK